MGTQIDGGAIGLVYAEIDIENVMDLARVRTGEGPGGSVRRATVRAMVDTGAYMMVIPETLRVQLGLEIVGRRRAVTADGKTHDVPIAGPVNVRFANRFATCNAMVMGNGPVLLGAIPLEELDVVIDPKSRTLAVNPENPDVPKMVVMEMSRRRADSPRASARPSPV